jgi:hypothetical protein
VCASIDLLKGTGSSCSLFHNDSVADFMVETLCDCVTYAWWFFLAYDLWLCPDLLRSAIFKAFGLLPPRILVLLFKDLSRTMMNPLFVDSLLGQSLMGSKKL